MNVTETLKVIDNTPEESLDYGQLYQELDEDDKEKINYIAQVFIEIVKTAWERLNGYIQIFGKILNGVWDEFEDLINKITC